MDYDSTMKFCFLFGFLCCWLICLTVRAVTGAVRLFLLRMEVKELSRQIEELEQSPAPSGQQTPPT